MSTAPRRDEPPIVFLDSNVIFSGLHSPYGAPGRIIEQMLEGSIKVVISQQILEEVARTFSKKLPQALPSLSEFFINSPISVVIDPDPEECRRWTDTLDEGDARIFTATLAVDIDYFVTGDNHFLNNATLKQRSNLRICSPSQFMEELDS